MPYPQLLMNMLSGMCNCSNAPTTHGQVSRHMYPSIPADGLHATWTSVRVFRKNGARTRLGGSDTSGPTPSLLTDWYGLQMHWTRAVRSASYTRQRHQHCWMHALFANPLDHSSGATDHAHSSNQALTARSWMMAYQHACHGHVRACALPKQGHLAVIVKGWNAHACKGYLHQVAAATMKCQNCCGTLMPGPVG